MDNAGYDTTIPTDTQVITEIVSDFLKTNIDPSFSINNHYGYGGDDIFELSILICDLFNLDRGDFDRRLKFDEHFYHEPGPPGLFSSLFRLIRGKGLPLKDFFVRDLVDLVNSCRREGSASATS